MAHLFVVEFGGVDAHDGDRLALVPPLDGGQPWQDVDAVYAAVCPEIVYQHPAPQLPAQPA